MSVYIYAYTNTPTRMGPQESSKTALQFDEDEPAGSYVLNLARIFDRTVLRRYTPRVSNALRVPDMCISMYMLPRRPRPHL